MRTAVSGAKLLAWDCPVVWVGAESGSSYAGQPKTPGRSIGQVSTHGDLIVIELDRAALGQPNLFDLVGRTLRFSPAGSRYRVTNQPLRWEADYGAASAGSEVSLQRFTFLSQDNGGVRFPWERRDPFDSVRRRKRVISMRMRPFDGGIASAIGRFDRLGDVGGKLGSRAPAISVFLKPRMAGPHYVREFSRSRRHHRS